jgi:hypothetical protein
MVVTKGSRPEPHKVLIPEGRTLMLEVVSKLQVADQHRKDKNYRKHNAVALTTVDLRVAQEIPNLPVGKQTGAKNNDQEPGPGDGSAEA